MMKGQELQNIRKAVGLTQTDFARLVGVGRIAVSDWERDVNVVPGAAEIVARVLEQSPEMLGTMQRWRGLSTPSIEAVG